MSLKSPKQSCYLRWNNELYQLKNALRHLFEEMPRYLMYRFLYKVEVYVPAKLFQPSQLFVGKAKSLP